MHRIIRGEDFRRVLRRGDKHPSALGLIAVADGHSAVSRFGFVVSKAVGGAVVRNRIKRRLRAACAPYTRLTPVRDVVIRVAPSATQLSFGEITAELERVLGRAGSLP